MMNPRHACARGTCQALGLNPKSDLLHGLGIVITLPRHASVVTAGYSDLMRRQSLGVIVVEMYSHAVRESVRIYSVALGCAPGKRPVESPRHPRPPPDVVSLRARKKPDRYWYYPRLFSVRRFPQL